MDNDRMESTFFFIDAKFFANIGLYLEQLKIIMYFCGTILNKDNVMKLRLLIGTLMLAATTANAQVATINQQFEGFTKARTATWPQFDWARFPNPSPATGPWVYADNNDGASDMFIYYYSFFTQNVGGYLITPQIVAPDGTKTLTFKGWSNKGETGVASATVEIGMVDSQTDMSNFTLIGSPINLTTTESLYTVTIPASTKQYIAFRMTGGANHVAISVDEVVYDSTTVLGTSDITKSKEAVKFAVNSDNTALQFIAKKDPKNVQVYSALGQKVSEGKLSDQKFDISALQAGVYFILIETAEGTAVKSKFIKK